MIFPRVGIDSNNLNWPIRKHKLKNTNKKQTSITNDIVSHSFSVAWTDIERDRDDRYKT